MKGAVKMIMSNTATIFGTKVSVNFLDLGKRLQQADAQPDHHGHADHRPGTRHDGPDRGWISSSASISLNAQPCSTKATSGKPMLLPPLSARLTPSPWRCSPLTTPETLPSSDVTRVPMSAAPWAKRHG
jgi:hypothetical protein